MPALTKRQIASRAAYKSVCKKKGVTCLALCGGVSIRKRQRLAKETAEAARVAAVERSLVAAQVRVMAVVAARPRPRLPTPSTFNCQHII